MENGKPAARRFPVFSFHDKFSIAENIFQLEIDNRSVLRKFLPVDQRRFPDYYDVIFQRCEITVEKRRQRIQLHVADRVEFGAPPIGIRPHPAHFLLELKKLKSDNPFRGKPLHQRIAGADELALEQRHLPQNRPHRVNHIKQLVALRSGDHVNDIVASLAHKLLVGTARGIRQRT